MAISVVKLISTGSGKKGTSSNTLREGRENARAKTSKSLNKKESNAWSRCQGHREEIFRQSALPAVLLAVRGTVHTQSTPQPALTN